MIKGKSGYNILQFRRDGIVVRFSREVTGIPVIHKTSGRELGRVKEWLLNGRGEAVIAFVAEESGWLTRKKFFSFQDIATLGRDAVMVTKEGNTDYGDTPVLDGELTCRVLGKRVLNSKGSEYGIVDDILFEEQTGRITGWRLSSGIIDDLLSGRPVLEPQPVFAIGDDLIIVPDAPTTHDDHPL
jgi:uncharacterized protein YrrD